MDEDPAFDWNQIKIDLKSSSGEVVDSQHALLLLRKVTQKRKETIHVYAERLLAFGEDAFEGEANDAIQKQEGHDGPVSLHWLILGNLFKT